MTGRLSKLGRLGASAAGLAVAAALGMGLSSDAGARGPGGHGYDKGARLERAIEKMQLDEAKRAEVFGVIDSARPAGRELRDRVHAERTELRAMLASPDAGEEAVLAKADAIAAAEAELDKHELRTLLQVRARLSAEQQAQLAEAMEKRHCGGRHERRHVL